MAVVGSIGALSSAGSIDPTALQVSLAASKASKSQKIEQAGTQFEAIFVRQFLGDALKPMIKGAMDEGGEANDTYRYFVTDQLANSLAQQGVFGIGKQVASQIKARESAHELALEKAAAATGSQGDKSAVVATLNDTLTHSGLNTSREVVKGLAAVNEKSHTSRR